MCCSSERWEGRNGGRGGGGKRGEGRADFCNLILDDFVRITGQDCGFWKLFPDINGMFNGFSDGDQIALCQWKYHRKTSALFNNHCWVSLLLNLFKTMNN